jgi:phage-related holin
MISKKYYGIVMSCLAAIFISVPISFVMTIINVGFTEDFILAFLKSAAVGIVISVPLANIGVPIAEKIAKKIVKNF